MTVKRIILILKTCGDSDSSLRPATTSASQDGSSFSRNQRSYDVEGRLCGHLLAASYQLSIAGPEYLAVAVTYSKGRPSAYAYTFPNNCTLNLAIARDSGNDGWETGRTYTMGMATVYDWQASHDALGLPSATADTLSAARSWTYNARSEMTGCTANDGSYSYMYDTIGNRLSSTEASGGYYGSSRLYIANGLNKYDYVDSTAFTYDADGSLTNDCQFVYAYDCENRLVSVTPVSPSTGDLAIVNEYDHMNRRVRKTVLQFDGMDWNEQETHSFAWDGWNMVLERIDYADFTTSSRVIEYYWGDDLSGSEQGAGGVGGLLAVSCDGKFYVPIYGGNGNIMGYVDESGTLVAKFVYDPYGNVVSISDDIGNSAYAGLRGEDFSFGFSTKYHDREVGLIAYQLRSYSPRLGRWLNRDPIEEAGGVNLYGFLGNCQVCIADVLGLLPYQTTVWGTYWYPSYNPPDRSPRSSQSGTFRESILDFVWPGTGRTYRYYYPQHSATVRLLKHPKVAEVWKNYKNVRRVGYYKKGKITHTARWYDFFRDVYTMFGTEFTIISSPGETLANRIYGDFGYEVLGSFSGTYTITTDSRTCTKKLKMKLDNKWSLKSLTRNPFSDKSILPKSILELGSRFWEDIAQEYYYNVIEPIPNQRH